MSNVHFLAQVSGHVTYNGYSTAEFVVQRTAAYVDQQDNHIAELTARHGMFKKRPVSGTLVLVDIRCLLA